MKAPKPKMLDFADVELVKNLCGGLDKKLKATITAVPVLGRFGWQVPFSTKKGDFVRTVKEESKAYKVLFDEFGDNFDDWPGKSISIFVHVIEEGNEFEGTESIVFEPL